MLVVVLWLYMWVKTDLAIYQNHWQGGFMVLEMPSLEQVISDFRTS